MQRNTLYKILTMAPNVQHHFNTYLYNELKFIKLEVKLKRDA